MRRSFAILSLVALSACAVPGYIPKETTFFGIDFTKYTDRGFLITPESYAGEYYSVGTVNYVITPAAHYVKRKIYSEGITGTPIEIHEWKTDRIEIAEGLDSLYTIARRMGANAVINFEAKPEIKEYRFVKNPITITGYRLSGYAIRRKGN